MSFNIAQQFIKEIVKIYFSLFKNSCEIFNTLKSSGFIASGLSTDISTLYTTLPHNLIKE